MKQLPLAFKPVDIVILVLVLAVAVGSGFLVYGDRSAQTHLVIEAPSGKWIYSLDTDRTVEIPGPLGNTVVRIENGSASILDSPCPNKTCIAGPHISHKGEWNACLPNQVILRIDGEGEEDGLDAVAN